MVVGQVVGLKLDITRIGRLKSDTTDPDDPHATYDRYATYP